MRKFTVPAFLFLLLLPFLSYAQRGGNLQPQDGRFQLAEGLGPDDYWQGKVIFKVKESMRAYCTEYNIAIPEISDYRQRMAVQSIRKSFPRSTPPSEPYNALGERLADLSLIYELDYAQQVGIEDAVNFLLQTGVVEYAEPSYIYKPFYNPNDPDTAQQYYLSLIHAREAWDISKGDSTIKIGIVDTGGSYTHPDWGSKVAYNWNDPVDGIDNDNNGFIDDNRGWDFGGDIWGSFGDNGANWCCSTPASDHGVLVGGAAAAATDNGINVAAIGFNCSLFPVKVSIDESPIIYRGFQGVVYAADMGVQIMNLSWGGGGTECRMCYDAIRYATINKGVLVVAAAGNTPSYINFYPASYPEVISVPGTQQNDQWWLTTPGQFGSTWSYLADVCSPSRDILTTTTDIGTYSATGTSLGSPIVCGIAGLVKEHFPSLNMRQVGQMVRMGADENVYNINATQHPEQMGKGRADALGALNYVGPAVRAVKVMYDTDDDLIQAGDTVDVRVRFVNFLDPVTNLQIDLSTPSFAEVEIVHGSAYAGNLGTLDTASTWVCPFKIVIRPNTPDGKIAYLRLGYIGNGYTDYEYYAIKVKPSYVNIDANRIETSMDGRGRWGYTNFPNLSTGKGLDIDGTGSLINDAGFLVGKDATHVVNNIENQTGGADFHFINATPIVRTLGAPKADLEATAAFTDASGGTNMIGLNVSQHTYQWNMSTDDDYIIQEYTIKNTTGANQNGLYAGMYFDLDGFWRTQNRGHYDPVSRTIYNMDTTWVTLWDIGISLLTPDSLHGYTADVNVFNYTTASKWTAITSPPTAAELGPANIAQFIGAGPFNIAPGDSHVVAFAIVMGDSLNGMRESRQAAYEKYWCVVRNGMNPQTDLGPDIYNCGSTTPVTLDAGPGFSTYEWNTGATTQTISATDGDYWVLTTDVNGCQDYDRVRVDLDPGITGSYTYAPSQIFVGDTVTFTSTTATGIEWCWNWGDGSTECPITSAAIHAFSQPGTYNVCMIVGNGNCTDTVCQSIVVDTVVAVSNPSSMGLLTVFPVPASDLLRIRLENETLGPVSIELYDLAGKRLWENSLQKQSSKLEATLDLQPFPAGAYLLLLRDGLGTHTKKVLIE